MKRFLVLCGFVIAFCLPASADTYIISARSGSDPTASAATSASPVWLTLNKVSDGSAVSSPATVAPITHIGTTNLYKIVYDPTGANGRVVGVVDFGAAFTDKGERYLEIDLAPNTDGALAISTNTRVLTNLDAAVSSRGTSNFAGGAVASVTGNVGGNVAGSVGSISGITFPTGFPTLLIGTGTDAGKVTTSNPSTSSSGPTPSDFWNYPTRSLTDKAGYALQITPPTAADIWNFSIKGRAAWQYTLLNSLVLWGDSTTTQASGNTSNAYKIPGTTVTLLNSSVPLNGNGKPTSKSVTVGTLGTP